MYPRAFSRSILEASSAAAPYLTQLLIHDIVKDACERGHLWFDFNPSGGHESVKAFKKGFGAEERPSGVVQRSSRAEKVVGALSRLRLPMKRS